MRAVRVSGPEQVDLVDLADPNPRSGETLVRPLYVGVCGTDRRLARRGSDPPRVPGHEVAGMLADDMPVGVHPDIGCGHCSHCRQGFGNRCPYRVSIGLDRDGGMAEWMAVPEDHVVPLDGVPLRDAPLLEPLACCLHAVSLLQVQPGGWALVVGAGPMGILAIWALQAAGARVVVSQRSEERRRLADRLGAHVIVGDGEDPVAALGEPPQVAVVTAPNRKALAYALEVVAVGGRVHAFAGMPEGGEVDANLVHYRHLTLIGSTGSRIEDYRRALELAATGQVDLSLLPVRSISLEETPGALLGGSTAQKVIIDLEERGKR
jgi:L-iditol 2-dehydrogenase